MTREAEKSVPVRDLEPGDEFSYRGAMWKVTDKDKSRVEARNLQFSNIITFYNPTRPENFNAAGPTWYTGVRKI